ncbi:MAG: hypothetical protein AVDCRST_MAG14-910 [uncultured Rubrobacteraceae bacterium]|uniref:Uncharacterized protein n=1 Tax=uncultured Rubrobacteraceae bacterium TaxID=349277 RepID=A0A6J4QZE4_9ACTN|nr:MAG: hypothetical protein AVDCRST_MAG14-910 [uncultured Rubrobacteraceae bacterium]
MYPITAAGIVRSSSLLHVGVVERLLKKLLEKRGAFLIIGR